MCIRDSYVVWPRYRHKCPNKWSLRRTSIIICTRPRLLIFLHFIRDVPRYSSSIYMYRLPVARLLRVIHSLIYFSITFIVFALLFALPPSRNSDPGSHSRLFSPPTHYGSCLAFLSREDFSSFFPRRLASNCHVPAILN